MNEAVNIILKRFLTEPSFWLIIIVGILSSLFYTKIRGFMGEFWVKLELGQLPKNRYLVLNDIMIKSSQRHTPN